MSLGTVLFGTIMFSCYVEDEYTLTELSETIGAEFLARNSRGLSQRLTRVENYEMALLGLGSGPFCIGVCGVSGEHVAWTYRPPGRSPVLEVDVVPVVKSRIESSIELTGTLFPWKFATIASEVTGVIESIPESGEKIEYEIDGQAYSRALPLDIGHQVKQGDVLVKIELERIAALELRLAEAKQIAMEKELANLYAWKRSEEIAQLKAQCDECEAVLVDAEADLLRAQIAGGSQRDFEEGGGGRAAVGGHGQGGPDPCAGGPGIGQGRPHCWSRLRWPRRSWRWPKAEVALKQDIRSTSAPFAAPWTRRVSSNVTSAWETT